MSEILKCPKVSVTSTAIHDVLVIEPKVFGDERGWFTESFNAQDFSLATGLNVEFVQGTEPPAEASDLPVTVILGDDVKWEKQTHEYIIKAKK